VAFQHHSYRDGEVIVAVLPDYLHPLPVQIRVFSETVERRKRSKLCTNGSPLESRPRGTAVIVTSITFQNAVFTWSNRKGTRLLASKEPLEEANVMVPSWWVGGGPSRGRAQWWGR